MTPKPLWKSMYSVPSTSQTRARRPRATYTGQGSERWNDDGTPAGMTAFARAKYSPERDVRATSRSRSRAVSAATRSRWIPVVAGVVAVIGSSLGSRVAALRAVIPPQQRAADLAACGLGQRRREVDDARVLVGRRL